MRKLDQTCSRSLSSNSLWWSRLFRSRNGILILLPTRNVALGYPNLFWWHR